MRVIFAGTPEFACPPLRALIEQHEVVAVFTQPDRRAGRGKKMLAPPVKKLAEKNNIVVHQPISLKDNVELVAQYQADVMVVVAYGILLPQSILDTPDLGCLNIHASVLPRWRGAAPIQRAIEAGDCASGVSIMRMEAGLDTGPVFDVFNTQIDSQETQQSLHDRLAEMGAEGIIKTLQSLQENPHRQPQQQNDANACYAHKLNKVDAVIDWQLSSSEIANKVRAFNPWPVCQTSHNGIRLRIWQASSANNLPIQNNEISEIKPGSIVVNQGALWVACGQGYLQLETVQRDGGKPINTKQLLNGYAIAVGDRLI